jgi:hypothetical protein
VLEVLAERIIWDGGIETLFKGIFLWAFNSFSPYYYLAPDLRYRDYQVEMHFLDFSIVRHRHGEDTLFDFVGDVYKPIASRLHAAGHAGQSPGADRPVDTTFHGQIRIDLY